MSDDLVRRLRRFADSGDSDQGTSEGLHEAVDEIERLRDENRKLRAERNTLDHCACLLDDEGNVEYECDHHAEIRERAERAERAEAERDKRALALATVLAERDAFKNRVEELECQIDAANQPR